MGYNLVLLRPKNRDNIGSIIRTAQNFDVNTLFIVGGLITDSYKGDIHKFDHQMNTQDGLAKINLMYFATLPELLNHLPAQTSIVLVETYGQSGDLVHFQHPANATYVFGRETTGIEEEEKNTITEYISKKNINIPDKYRNNHTKTVHLRMVRINTRQSLNLSVCAAIVMYDRHCKLTGTP